jgi:hypothetical protein
MKCGSELNKLPTEHLLENTGAKKVQRERHPLFSMSLFNIKGAGDVQEDASQVHLVHKIAEYTGLGFSLSLFFLSCSRPKMNRNRLNGYILVI